MSNFKTNKIKKEFKPRCCSIVACFNQAQYLTEAVESIISQTYPHKQIIMINDGSTDNTEEVMIRLVEKYSNNINIHRINTPDIGATFARTEGIAHTKTKYFHSLDADDTIESTFLEKTVELLESNPDIAFAYTDTNLFGEGVEKGAHWDHKEYNGYELIFNNFISYCSLIRRSAFDAIGGYDLGNWNYYEDWQLWVKFFRKGFYGKHIPEKLFNYRQRADSGMQDGGVVKSLDTAIKSYFVMQYPELYPPYMKDQAKFILQDYPENFMSMDRKSLKKLLEEKKKS